jgi:hypothetical protein
MTSIYVAGRGFQTKPQFKSIEAPDGFPISDIASVEIGIIIREYELANITHLNQVEFKSAVDTLRNFFGKTIINSLPGIYGENYIMPLGGSVRDIVNNSHDTGVGIWATMPEGSIGFWIGTGSAVLDRTASAGVFNIMGRVYEKISEDYLKAL